MAIYRQGDVLFVEMLGEVPQGKALRRKQGRIVVAEGESTGHAHAVATPGVKFIEVVRLFQEHYLVSSHPFKVVHEEHDTVALPAGTFKVIRQREHTPQGNRQVRD